MKFIIPFVLFFSGLALQAQTASAPTLADAQQFMTQAEARLGQSRWLGAGKLHH
jgi:hypothetical protein